MAARRRLGAGRHTTINPLIIASDRIGVLKTVTMGAPVLLCRFGRAGCCAGA
jgi:hypothetical protein